MSDDECRVQTVNALTELSGLEVWRRIADGRLPRPPFAAWTGLELVDVGEGRAVFRLAPDGRMATPLGTVHGGVAATLLDSCMGCAVHTTLPARSTFRTAQLNVHYVRAVTPGMGPITAIGDVTHAGRRHATAEGRLLDGDGRLLAHGTTTCLVLR